MAADVLIGVVGDRDDTITAHRALPFALDLAAQAEGVALRYEWLATDADHAETAGGNDRRLVVSQLECSLVEARETLTAVPGSRQAAAYGAPTFDEAYRCRFGLNADFLNALLDGPLAVAATGPGGDIRALELRRDEHPFYLLTLFQPERAALQGQVPPLLRALVAAAAEHKTGSR
jgi:CTP synthase (UTP-ammonia lyase)